jgi:hypothetical protein
MILTKLSKSTSSNRKSNSDKFLESLELDCVGSDKSLKRKLRQKNSKVRVTAFNKFYGGGWQILSWIIFKSFKSFPADGKQENLIENVFLFTFIAEETNLSDTANSPVIGNRSAAATLAQNAASHPSSPSTTKTDGWPSQSDEDIDRLVAMHQNRHNSLSSLGVSHTFLCQMSKRLMITMKIHFSYDLIQWRACIQELAKGDMEQCKSREWWSLECNTTTNRERWRFM